MRTSRHWPTAAQLRGAIRNLGVALHLSARAVKDVDRHYSKLNYGLLTWQCFFLPRARRSVRNMLEICAFLRSVDLAAQKNDSLPQWKATPATFRKASGMCHVDHRLAKDFLTASYQWMDEPICCWWLERVAGSSVRASRPVRFTPNFKGRVPFRADTTVDANWKGTSEPQST